MLVKFWMKAPPITLPPDATVGRAAEEMARRHVRRLLVVDSRARLRGIVSLLDVARAFPPDLNPLSVDAGRAPPIPVRKIMTSSVVTTEPTTPIASAARVLRTKKVGALPVVTGQTPVGIITESDIFDAFIEMSGVRRRSTAITLVLSPDATPMDVARIAEQDGLEIESFFCTVSDGARTMTLRVPGRVHADTVESLYAHGWKILDVHPQAIS